VVDALRPRSTGSVGDELGEHLGVRRGGELDALLGELVTQPARVGEVSVVAEHQLVAFRASEDRLHVREGVRAGGAVAGVADRGSWRPVGVIAALEAQERLLVEDAADQTEALMERQACPVADGDAGRFLAPVLEGVEPDVGQSCDRLAWRPDADDAALLVRPAVDVERLGDG
jgi:hypothetical protein